jgi:hypothetical protein
MYMIDDEFQWFKDGPDSGEVESNRGELRRELNQENAGEAWGSFLALDQKPFSLKRWEMGLINCDETLRLGVQQKKILDYN